MIKETLNSLSDLTNDPNKNKFIAYDTNKTRNDDTSIFEDDALIDYARTFENGELNPVDTWEKYKKDATKNNFIRNNPNPINIPVNYSTPQTEDETGFDINKIITWSSKYPSLRLRFQDFVYCTKLGYYPNNRLVVLRKFKNGIEDSLFDIVDEKVKPIATMVTWLNHDDDIFSSFTFKENWEEYTRGMMDTIKNAYGVTDDNSSKKNNLLDIANDAVGALVLNTFAEKIDGTDFTQSPYGNPNLIAQTMKRVTLNGDTSSSSGLTSAIQFDLTFEYELRYIQDIDPSIAFVDLMSNAFHMGTSESEFKYNIKGFKDIKTGIESRSLLTQKESFTKVISNFTKSIGKTFTDTLKKIADSFLSKDDTDAIVKSNKAIDDKNKIIAAQNERIVANNKKNNTNTPTVELSKTRDLSKTGFSSIIDQTIAGVEYIMSRYREALKASISVDTGIANGIWHVTIGNPRAPIVSIGDLVVTESKLNLGKEFGYNDFPNSFSVNYTVKSARPKGRQELSKIFNSGRGRLYVYQKATDNPDYNMIYNDI